MIRNMYYLIKTENKIPDALYKLKIFSSLFLEYNIHSVRSGDVILKFIYIFCNFVYYFLYYVFFNNFPNHQESKTFFQYK